MVCPKCQGDYTTPRTTHPNAVSTLRHHKCKVCKYRWTSIAMTEEAKQKFIEAEIGITKITLINALDDMRSTLSALLTSLKATDATANGRRL